jgi:hypothetical protein
MKEMDPDVEEHLQSARSELKRVDHLIYVSLKYTRTVDVIRNTVSRIINTYDSGVLAVLTDLKLKKKIDDLPSSPVMKVELLQKSFTDDYVREFLDFYLLLRKLMKLDYTRREEYRRHVTMITVLDNNTDFEVDIDKLEEYYKKTKEFINHLTNIITGKKDD